MALSVSTQSSALRSLWTAVGRRRSYAKVASSSSYAAEGRREKKQVEAEAEEGVDVGEFAVSSGISRPLSEILKQLNKKVPDSLVKTRSENGFTSKYIPWYSINFP